MQRQPGQGSSVDGERLAKSRGKMAVMCREEFILSSRRAIRRQQRENFVCGRGYLVLLKLFLSNICRGRMHGGPPGRGYFLTARSVLRVDEIALRVWHFHSCLPPVIHRAVRCAG